MSETMTPAPKGRRRRPVAPTTPDAIEIAMEAEASGEAPEGAARTLLEEHILLAQADRRHRGWQIAGERASFALKVLTGLVGVIAAVVISAVLWSAAHYRGLTVQPFSVPPALETRGLSGAAVATRLLDKLGAMQDATQSGRAANTFANSWGDDLQVEIPQTGVSAGELWKFLRSWLGEEVKITGEIVQTGDGRLQLTARAGGHGAPLLTGSEAELEALLDRAAEAIYARTQPYRYAVYVMRTGRADEARAALEPLSLTGDPVDRKWAYIGRGYMARSSSEALAMAGAAIAIDPEFGQAYVNRSSIYLVLGLAEAAHRGGRTALRLTEGSDGYDPGEWVKTRALSLATDRQLENDWLGAVAALDGLSETDSWLDATFSLASAHDPRGAKQRLRQAPDDPSMPPFREWMAVRMASGLEDWAAILAQPAPVFPNAGTDALLSRIQWATTVEPSIVLALARAGRPAEAEARLRDLPLSSYWVVIANGQVAAIKGDVAGSERWFARAAAAGPSLADADQAWGRARLDRRDFAGAIERYKVAAERAPKWADPLKGWGDALAGQGDHKAALKTYAAAAERAPRWGKLHIAWGRSLAALGRRDEAVAKWRAAAGMDLSPADRTAVTRLLAG